MIGRTNTSGGQSAEAKIAAYCGDGSDGDLVVASGQTVSLPVTTDSGQIIKQYNNLTINAGGVLTPAARCNGMILLVKGDLTVHGSIDVSNKAPFLNDAEDKCSQEAHIKLCNAYFGSVIGGNGGNGGKGGGGNVTAGAGGAGGRGFWCGGGMGGGGGAALAYVSGDNYDAANYARAGTAGDPRPPANTSVPLASYANGGNVGQYTVWATGGSGPGGSGGSVALFSSRSDEYNGKNGSAFGGGGVWIFVRGKTTITGNITANGGNGANSSGDTYPHVCSGGGGGGGGGIIIVAHSGKYELTGNLAATGGTTGSVVRGECKGTNGSAGFVQAVSMNDLLASA